MWLNRSGTILAVILNEEINRDEALKEIEKLSKEDGLEIELIAGADALDAAKDFKGDSKWYRSFNVMELSREEGQKVADNLFMQFQKNIGLDQKKTDALRKAFGQNFF